MFNIIIAGLEA